MHDEPDGRYRITKGTGPRLRPRTLAQKMETRRKARRDFHSAVIDLRDYLPNPKPNAWYEASRSREYWWGNLLRHAEEVIDSPNPPSYERMMAMGEAFCWAIRDMLDARGIKPRDDGRAA